MDIEQMNNTVIEGITNSLSDGPDAAFEFAIMNYTNSNNDYFKKSRGFAEEVIFRTYEYRCFHENTEELVDFKRYVLDSTYRIGIHGKRLEALDADAAKKKLWMGSDLYHSGEIEKAVECYREAAYRGNISAMYEYGLFRCDGEGCEKNELFGSFWYWEAAQNGEVRAMYNLGVNYREGVGVKKDMTQMLYWYAKSAGALCKEAIYSLGSSLANEEVLSGENTVQIGRIMMRASADVSTRTRVQDFVKNNTKIIIQILKENGDLYNI